MSKEREAELIFLCVFDPCIAGEPGEPLTEAIEKEQRWLGRALLGTAQVRARRQGVEAGAVVLCGPILETIEGYLRRVNASVLVLGEPKVALHIAALPPEFLMPGISLLSTARGIRSLAQVCADLYIAQKAVFAVTGSSTAGWAVSAFLAGWVGSEPQAVRSAGVGPIGNLLRPVGCRA